MCLLEGPENGMGILLGMLFKKWPELGLALGLNMLLFVLEASALIITMNQTWRSMSRNLELLVSFFLIFWKFMLVLRIE